jgi:phospholipid/cholesterol/gamma-HCH transport system permease protein
MLSKTMGLDPLRFLVVQRIMAGLLLNPLLTIYSYARGRGQEGWFVMLMLGFPLDHHLPPTRQRGASAGPRVRHGSMVRRLAVLSARPIGCLRGLQTRKGPIAVGESTTRAGGHRDFIIIIVDAVFAVIYYALF